MERFWTSKKSINGIRHFVLLNETREKGQIIFFMVSVLDAEINLKITKEELVNSPHWEEGWLALKKIDAILLIKKTYLFDAILSSSKEIVN